MTEIRIPFRDPGERLVSAVPDLSHALDSEEDRAVFRALAIDTLSDNPDATAGDLVGRFEALDTADRRQLVNRARESVALPTLDELESRRRFELAQPAGPPKRDERGLALQGCHAAGCQALPLDALGLPEGVVDRRWFCDVHKHQAGPEDHLPPDDAAPRVDGHFGLLPSRAEQELQITEDQRRREQFRAEQEVSAAENERIQKLEDEYRRTPRSDWPPNFGPQPGAE